MADSTAVRQRSSKTFMIDLATRPCTPPALRAPGPMITNFLSINPTDGQPFVQLRSVGWVCLLCVHVYRGQPRSTSYLVIEHLVRRGLHPTKAWHGRATERITTRNNATIVLISLYVAGAVRLRSLVFVAAPFVGAPS